MKKIDEKELKDILKKHLVWIESSRKKGKRANLRWADLWLEDLHGANLQQAQLQEAALGGADLQGANLGNANLREANLWGANLWGANLQGATLYGANLEKTDLCNADLRGANLTLANLTDSCISNIQRVHWIIEGVTCDYCFFDEDREIRMPKDRHFGPGEFEQLMADYPSFEYYFDNGMHPLAEPTMERITEAIRCCTDMEIYIDCIQKRGTVPYIRFIVKNEWNLEPAQALVGLTFPQLIKQFERMIDSQQTWELAMQCIGNQIRENNLSNIDFQHLKDGSTPPGNKDAKIRGSGV